MKRPFDDGPSGRGQNGQNAGQQHSGGHNFSGRPNEPLLAKMFVGGLAQSVDGAKLGAYFETRYNCVVSEAMVMYDHATRRSRGFGFVTLEDGACGAALEAQRANAHAHQIDAKSVELKRAAPQAYDPRGAPTGGGGGGGGGGSSFGGSGGGGGGGGFTGGFTGGGGGRDSMGGGMGGGDPRGHKMPRAAAGLMHGGPMHAAQMLVQQSHGPNAPQMMRPMPSPPRSRVPQMQQQMQPQMQRRGEDLDDLLLGGAPQAPPSQAAVAAAAAIATMRAIEISMRTRGPAPPSASHGHATAGHGHARPQLDSFGQPLPQSNFSRPQDNFSRPQETMPTEVDAFLRANAVDADAARLLRALDPSSLAAVLAEGPVPGVNKSACLVSRVSRLRARANQSRGL